MALSKVEADLMRRLSLLAGRDDSGTTEEELGERLRKLTGKEEGGSSESATYAQLASRFRSLAGDDFSQYLSSAGLGKAQKGAGGAVDDLVDMYLQEAEESGASHGLYDRMEDEEGDIMAAFSVLPAADSVPFSMFMNAMDQVNAAADGDEDEIDLIMAQARDAALLEKRHGSSQARRSGVSPP